jgi:hypothetical protein
MESLKEKATQKEAFSKRQSQEMKAIQAQMKLIQDQLSLVETFSGK